MAHDTGKQAALGRVLVALSALAWSTAGIFTKGVEADVWTVLLWRGLLAGGVMSAWLVWRRGQAGLSDWKHLGWAGWSAATVSSAATICFIAAFKNTAVANVAIIYATAPFAAAAIAWVWMRETPGLATLAAAGLCLAGVTVMVGGSAGSPDLTGDLLALGMTALMALMMVIMRRHPDRPMTLAVGPVSCLQLVAIGWVMSAQLDVSVRELVLLAGFGVVTAAFRASAVSRPSSASRPASSRPWWPPPRWSSGSTSGMSIWSANSAPPAPSRPSCNVPGVPVTRCTAPRRGGCFRSRGTSSSSAPRYSTRCSAASSTRCTCRCIRSTSLAQQVVAMVAAEDWSEDALLATVHRAWPYRNLDRERWRQLLAMLAGGFATRRGRRSAYLHRDVVNGELRARRGARLPDHPLVEQTIAECADRGDGHRRARIPGDATQGRRDSGRLPRPHRALPSRGGSPRTPGPTRSSTMRRSRSAARGRCRCRRGLDPASAADIGRLDVDAIDRVCEEAWPDAANPDEVHDALVVLGFATTAEAIAGRGADPADVARKLASGERSGWSAHLDALVASGRATRFRTPGGGPVLWCAAERLAEIEAALGGGRADPPLALPEELRTASGRDAALAELLRARLGSLGPVTAARLASDLGLTAVDIDVALVGLEAEGCVLRGRFTPGAASIEWCERRLLARIHRYTLGRLRREIEPVSRAEFVRFLFEWQRVKPDDRREGDEALAAVIAELEGFAAPAAAWETEILPARIVGFTPDMLDRLCLAGRASWARLAAPVRETPGRSFGPIRSTPIALFSRQGRRQASLWLAPAAADGELSAGPRSLPDSTALEDSEAEDWNVGGTGGSATFSSGTGKDVSGTSKVVVPQGGDVAPAPLSTGARGILAYLEARGASFFDDILAETGASGLDAAAALGELIAQGRVSADGFAGLRAFTGVSARRLRAVAEAGRWSCVARRAADAGNVGEDGVEAVARTLLRRYGVVFKPLLARESITVPWRDLLREFRRLEARGEIRGGRFVAGFTGEQYALPEAVETLRRVRRAPADGAIVTLSAADPLNLTGVVCLGERVSTTASTRIAFRDGVPIATLTGSRKIDWIEPQSPEGEWEGRNALLRRRIPTQAARSGRVG